MKGFDALVQASRILLDRGVRHELRILGDGPEMRALVAMVHRLGLGEAVVLSGHASPDTVRELLAKATAFVLPATWDPVNHTQDGIPVALMEAMAIGVPVVSTSTSGIPELIEDGRSGVLVPADNPVALATGIAQVITMGDEVRTRMLRAARWKIEADHDAQILAESFIQIATRIQMKDSG
jgi:colanic acid/amylovoran biosynthesis glycosyltransferase